MPAYSGYLTTPLDSGPLIGRFVGEMKQCRSRITVDKPEVGLSSMELLPGGTHEIYLFCNVGNITVSCRAWPQTGAGVGGVSLELLETSGQDILASDSSVGVGAWETLTLTYAATKTVYKVRLVNRTMPSGDSRCWIDQLELA